MAQSDPKMFRTMFDRVSRTLFFGGLFPALVLILTAPLLLPWFLGSGWCFSPTFLQFLTVSYLFALTCSPINFALINRNDYSLLWGLFRLLIVAGSVLISFFASLSPAICVALLSAANVISYLLEYLLWVKNLKPFTNEVPIISGFRGGK